MSTEAIAKNLRLLANSIEALAESISQPDIIEEEAPKVRERTIELEDIRAVLVPLTREGKQKQVKELISNYGAQKLSEVPEVNYQELLDKAKQL